MEAKIRRKQNSQNSLMKEQTIPRRKQSCKRAFVPLLVQCGAAVIASFLLAGCDEKGGANGDMYRKGYEEGSEVGRSQGTDVGTARGLELGTERGIEIGTARGIEIGRTQGIEIGTARGIQIGYTNGFAEGVGAGIKAGRAEVISTLTTGAVIVILAFAGFFLFRMGKKRSMRFPFDVSPEIPVYGKQGLNRLLTNSVSPNGSSGERK